MHLHPNTNLGNIVNINFVFYPTTAVLVQIDPHQLAAVPAGERQARVARAVREHARVQHLRDTLTAAAPAARRRARAGLQTALALGCWFVCT